MIAAVIRVLYVDDESTLLDLCKTYMERLGEFFVTTVTSAPEAIRILEMERFDAIISDYQMPEMDGIEFLKVIRARGDKTPFIIFTGKGREEVVIEGLNSGADFYLQKGGEPKSQFAELSHKIRHAISSRQADKSLLEREAYYRAVFENTGTASVIVEEDTTISLANAEFANLCGHSREEIEGKRRWTEFVMKEDLERMLAQHRLRRKDRKQAERHYEFRFVRKNGEVRNIYLSIDVIPGTKKSIASLLDITEYKTAEQALRESEEKYRNIFNNSIEGIFQSTPEGRFISANHAAAHMLGYESPEELISTVKDIGSDVFIDPDDRVRFISLIRKDCFLKNFEVRCRHKNGNIIWGVLNVYAVSDADGNILYHEGTCQDITERKRTEAELRTAQEKYTKAFLSVPDAITISELDSGRLIEVNDAATRIFGYSRDELIGKSTLELSIWQNKDDRDRFIDQVRKHGKVSQFEVLNQRKSGELFNTMVNADTISIGNVPCLIAIIRDITEQKKAEEALQKSEAKSHSLLENVPELILVHRNGVILYTNPAAVKSLGYQPDEVINRQISDFIAPEFHERVAAAVRQRICGIPVEPYEIEVMGKDGSRRNMVVNGTGIEFDGASANLIILVDITERKKVEEALQESEERFKHISELIPDFAYSCKKAPNEEFAIEWVTGAPEKITGYSTNEIRAMTCWKILVIDEDIPVFEKNVTGLSPGESVRCELRIRRKDGGIMWLSSYAKCVTVQKEPGYQRLYGGCRDITKRKKIEESLRESERERADIISFLPDATLVIDKTGTVLAWNRAMEEMTGVPAEQILGKGNYEYALPFYHERRPITIDLVLHDDPAIAAKYPFMKKKGRSLYSEIFIPHLNNGRGAYLWFMASPLYDAAGNITGAIESIRDITDRKRVEEELQIAQEKYTKAFLSAPDAISISELDTGRFIEVNDAATRIFGYSRDELMGKSAIELGILSKEDREHFIDQIRKQGRVSQFEIVERRKSGEQYNALVNADTISLGNLPYLITSVRDITERKKAEEALRESEERYSSIFDNNYSVSLLIDPDTGMIVDANAAAVRYYGYTRDILTSMGIYDLNRLPKEKVVTNLQRAKNEKAKHFFSAHYLATGEKRNVEIYSGPITLLGKSLFYSIIHDITERKKAEEAFKQKEAELHDILEGSPIPNFVIDRDHRIISWNKALEEATGIKAADMLGTTRHWQAFYNMERPCLVDLLVDGKTEIIQEWYAGKIDADRIVGGIYDGTDFFPHLGNNGKWLHFTASLIRDTGGNVIGAVETLLDVTEEKQSAEKILTLQQFQQSIIDNANVWISVLDPKGTILVWNTTAEQISGYLAKDVIGTNTIWKHLYPDPVYRKQVAENILDIIKKNTYVENFETRIRTKSGDEKIIWWNTQPLRDASGKPVQFITIGRDNTERRRSEERLRSLRQFEESVIKNANIWISVLDGKGTVSIWNTAAEKISGYKANEVIGKNTIWSQIYPDKEYRRTVTATIKEILGAHKYLENFETRIRTKDGQERIIWWNTRALQDVPGIDETFIAIGKDVTEQKTLSDAVTLANKKLNLLSSITRHDILNQLMALKGYLELSGDILDDPVKLAEFIAKEQKIANTIEDQIQFTKDYQNLGVAAPAWQKVNESVEMAKQSFPLRGIAVETDSSTLEVYADPLFKRVFYNLIDNAIRYGGEQITTIRISSQESDRGLVIVCEDDGVGVPADKKEAIFRQEYFKHTGLGLFLSREILGITGITIAENGSPGKGARFEIVVPKGMWRMKGASE